MNTVQIHKVLTKNVKCFQRVYPLDLLQSTLIKHSIIVVNLDKHYMPGSHRVAVCFSDSGYNEYFYSYGLPPFKFEIIAYLQRHSISCTFNRHRLQRLTSNVCGHYCCLYALHTARGLSMTSFVDMFIPARYTCRDIKAVPCSALSLERVPLAAGWRSSSRASHKYKYGTYTLIISVNNVALSGWFHALGRSGSWTRG